MLFSAFPARAGRRGSFPGRPREEREDRIWVFAHPVSPDSGVTPPAATSVSRPTTLGKDRAERGNDR